MFWKVKFLFDGEFLDTSVEAETRLEAFEKAGKKAVEMMGRRPVVLILKKEEEVIA